MAKPYKYARILVSPGPVVSKYEITPTENFIEAQRSAVRMADALRKGRRFCPSVVEVTKK